MSNKAEGGELCDGKFLYYGTEEYHKYRQRFYENRHEQKLVEFIETYKAKYVYAASMFGFDWDPPNFVRLQPLVALSLVEYDNPADINSYVKANMVKWTRATLERLGYREHLTHRGLIWMQEPLHNLRWGFADL